MTDVRKQAVELVDGDEDLLFADGLDEALVGVVSRFGMEPVAVYDRDKVIEMFRLQHEDPESEEAYVEAWEHFGFNVIGAWVGDRTPAYVKLLPRKIEVDQKESEKAMARFLTSDSTYRDSTAMFCAGRDAWRAAVEWVRENGR